MSEPLSDLELIKRIAEGEKRALETLYNRHSDRTFKFLLRLTANRPAAEDLTHDVFLEVWNSAKRFEGRSSVATWVLSSQDIRLLMPDGSKERSPSTICPRAPNPPPKQRQCG